MGILMGKNKCVFVKSENTKSRTAQLLWTIASLPQTVIRNGFSIKLIRSKQRSLRGADSRAWGSD